MDESSQAGRAGKLEHISCTAMRKAPASAARELEGIDRRAIKAAVRLFRLFG